MQAHVEDRPAVNVLADLRLMGEAVAAALASRGRSATSRPWRYGATRGPGGVSFSLPDRSWSGVLVCGVDDPLSLSAARALVSQGNESWLVITPTPAGAAWGALLEPGAGAVMSSGTTLDELAEALEALELGRPVMDAALRWEVLSRWESMNHGVRQVLGRLDRLTPREREVLAGLREGVPVARLAWGLGVSVATVRSQVRGILHKLDVGSQIAAVAAVARLEASGLFDG